MRNVYLNSKKYKLPSDFRVPTTIQYPQKRYKRNAPGTSFYKASMFERIPGQTPKEKALLAVPESKVQEKIVTDYTKQAKTVEKAKLDGLKLDEDLVFKTLAKLNSKDRKRKKEPKKNPKKSTQAKKIKKTTPPNFALSS